MKRRLLSLALGATLLALCSCKSGSTEQDGSDSLTAEKPIMVDSALLKKGVLTDLDYIIQNLELSDAMLKTLSEQQNLYSDALINSVTKVSEYESSRSKALNLGIYGADLNYIIHFGQTQSSLRYLVVSKQLADQIGVAIAFDQKVMDQYQANTNDKDSLITIVNRAYSNVKKYLRNAEQFQMSTLVIVGSWIENMYIATSTVDKCKNPAKVKKVLATIKQQQAYLSKMINLLETLNDGKDKTVLQTQTQLHLIDSIYVPLLQKEELMPNDVVDFRNKLSQIRNEITMNKKAE